jgi:hypothetical protein
MAVDGEQAWGVWGVWGAWAGSAGWAVAGTVVVRQVAVARP